MWGETHCFSLLRSVLHKFSGFFNGMLSDVLIELHDICTDNTSALKHAKEKEKTCMLARIRILLECIILSCHNILGEFRIIPSKARAHV